MSGWIFENIFRQIDLFRQVVLFRPKTLQSNQYKIIRVQPFFFFFLFSLYNWAFGFCGLLTMFTDLILLYYVFLGDCSCST